MGALLTALRGVPAVAAALRLTEQDALALCEDGDLLLARDVLEHRALRLRLELAVARDVGRLQRGRFPRQLSTALPAWTSCELLVRHNGQLLAMHAQADGVHLSPFLDRVGRGPGGNWLALRRLQRGVSTALLRQLSEELAPLAPLRWPQLPDAQAPSTAAPPRRPPPPPLLASVLSRALELWRASVRSARSLGEPADRASEGDPSNALGVDASDALGMLNAALAAAVYEQLGVLSLPELDAPLEPASLASRSSALETQWTPRDALGLEMRLVVGQRPPRE